MGLLGLLYILLFWYEFVFSDSQLTDEWTS